MANSEHLKIIKQGPGAWNKWREENPDIIPDLAWANMIGMNLQGIDLKKANMKLAFCRSTDFSNSDFSEAILYGTNFQDSVLHSVSMKKSDLEGANLISADLDNADLEGANMKLAVLDNAKCSRVNLLNAKKLGYKQLLNVETLANARIEAGVYEKLKSLNPELFAGEK